MNTRRATGADSSTASQPAPPDAKHSRTSRHAAEANNSSASQPAGAGNLADRLMRDIRKLGKVPTESTDATQRERCLAQRLRRARNAHILNDEHEAELTTNSTTMKKRRGTGADSSNASHPTGQENLADPPNPGHSKIRQIAQRIQKRKSARTRIGTETP